MVAVGGYIATDRETGNERAATKGTRGHQPKPFEARQPHGERQLYGKIFESMYDGTLSADWKAMVTFQQMIVLADSEGVIDYTPPALARRTGIPLEIIEHGIEKLQQPDPYSRSPDSDGRRIVLLDEHRPWGWSIVNYEHYRDMSRASDRREQSRLRKQKQRERESQDTDSEQVSRDVTLSHAMSRMSRHISVSVSEYISTSDELENLNESAFADYLQHRKDIRAKRLTDQGVKLAAKKLAALPHEQQQAVVDQTIANGWTGLFPEKAKNDKRKPSYAEQLAEDLANASNA